MIMMATPDDNAPAFSPIDDDDDARSRASIDDDAAPRRATTTMMKRAASVAESIDELLERRETSDVARERAESFSTHASDKSSLDDACVVAIDDARSHREIALENARSDRDARSHATNGVDYFRSFDSPPRAVTIADVCAMRASEGAITPDGGGVYEDVCRGMLRREKERFGAFVLDVNRAFHLEYRAQLIEWVLDVCAGERFAPATADVAIALMVRRERAISRARF